MTQNLGAAGSAIASSWSVGPLYGLNLALYAACFQALYKREMSVGNRVLLLASTIQIGLCTGHVISLLVQLFRGIVINAQGIASVDNVYFVQQSTPEHVAQNILYITNSLMGDAVMIWRCYIVWNKKVYVYAPLLLLLLATGVSGYAAMAHLALLPPSGLVFENSISNWIEPTWSLSLATQVLSTSLIVTRILLASFRQRHSNGQTYYSFIFWVIIESGALYSSTTIMLLAFYVTGEAAGAVCAAILGQLSATAPFLIIVRIEAKKLSERTSLLPSAGPMSHPSREMSTIGTQRENIQLDSVPFDTRATLVSDVRKQGDVTEIKQP